MGRLACACAAPSGSPACIRRLNAPFVNLSDALDSLDGLDFKSLSHQPTTWLQSSSAPCLFGPQRQHFCDGLEARRAISPMHDVTSHNICTLLMHAGVFCECELRRAWACCCFAGLLHMRKRSSLLRLPCCALRQHLPRCINLTPAASLFSLSFQPRSCHQRMAITGQHLAWRCLSAVLYCGASGMCLGRMAQNLQHVTFKESWSCLRIMTGNLAVTHIEGSAVIAGMVPDLDAR